ncbi:MAG TPA: manganese efflux pump MntP family protein [Polyangiaceae bacterium]
MSLANILLLAFGLSMDATAVAAARGLSVREVRLRHVLLVAAFFGGFQGLMPLVGWLLGRGVGRALEQVDHWIVFGVLGGIGAKMLWDARASGDAEARPTEQEAFRPRVLLMLAIATSIDALAAGFTLQLMGAPLLLSALSIGVTTALLSALGLLLGHRFGAAFGRRLDALGGVVLIGLGVSTLLQHLRGGA